MTAKNSPQVLAQKLYERRREVYREQCLEYNITHSHIRASWSVFKIRCGLCDAIVTEGTMKTHVFFKHSNAPGL